MARSTKPSVFIQAFLLCAATITAAAAAGDVASDSFPVFNATTANDLLVVTNSSILTPAALLFHSGELFSKLNASEGFLLLTHTVDVWRRAGTDSRGAPATLEASFNTSFTVEGSGSGSSSPVAFVVLLDRFPTFFNPNGLRGGGGGNNDSTTGAVPNATSSLAAVEIGAVKSYAPEFTDVGLNVTISKVGASATSRIAVWIEYDAAAHLLRVYVAAAGETRPPKALLDAPLNLAAGDRTTQTAYVGFFAARVRDVITGIRDWELAADRLPTNGNGGGGKKWPSWMVILMALLGSVTNLLQFL